MSQDLFVVRVEYEDPYMRVIHRLDTFPVSERLARNYRPFLHRYFSSDEPWERRELVAKVVKYGG